MLSPEEIRNLDLDLSIRGYAREQVDRLLEEIRASYSAVWNERTRLYDEVLELRAEVAAGKAAIAELAGEFEQARAAYAELLAELDERRALERVRTAAGDQFGAQGRGRDEEQAPSEDADAPSEDAPAAPEDAGAPLNGTASDTVPFDPMGGLSRPLRDMPFDALRDYVMQRFAFYNRSDNPKEPE